jgi:hypothetical protein
MRQVSQYLVRVRACYASALAYYTSASTSAFALGASQPSWPHSDSRLQTNKNLRVTWSVTSVSTVPTSVLCALRSVSVRGPTQRTATRSRTQHDVGPVL